MDFTEILNNKSFPYSKIMDDFKIYDTSDRTNFVEASLMYATNCYAMAREKNLNQHDELKGYFLWEAHNSGRYFKCLFTYYHSEELLFGINSVEELSADLYKKLVE